MAIRIITDSDQRIVNRIMVDENTPAVWHPGPGLTLHPEGVDGAIGGSLVGGVYTPPSEPEPEPGDSPPPEPSNGNGDSEEPP